MRIKYVTPLHIPLTRIKSEFKCIIFLKRTTLTVPLTRVKLKSNNFDSTYDAHQRWIKYMISLIQNKFDSTVNQMRPLSPVIRIKGNQIIKAAFDSL